VRSEDLLKGGVEILIEHHGREYRLRVTQNGKLILTA
jgi:hemin uptake protein HemP